MLDERGDRLGLFLQQKMATRFPCFGVYVTKVGGEAGMPETPTAPAWAESCSGPPPGGFTSPCSSAVQNPPPSADMLLLVLALVPVVGSQWLSYTRGSQQQIMRFRASRHLEPSHQPCVMGEVVLALAIGSYQEARSVALWCPEAHLGPRMMPVGCCLAGARVGMPAAATPRSFC